MLKIAVIGAGPAGITASINLETTFGESSVTLYRRGPHNTSATPKRFTLLDRDEKILSEMDISMVQFDPETSLEGLSSLSSADVVLLATPVHVYARVLELIKPLLALDRPVCVGTIYGQAFFNLIAKGPSGILGDLNNVISFSMAYIPWIVKRLGDSTVKVSSVEHFNLRFSSEPLQGYFLGFFEALTTLHPLNPIWVDTETEAEVSLVSDNWFLHTPRLLDLIRLQNSSDKPPLIPEFYGEYSDSALRTLESIEVEFEVMKTALRRYASTRGYSLPNLKLFSQMEELPDSDGNSYPWQGFKNYFKENTTSGYRIPTVEGPDGTWKIDLNNRMFADDVINGLSVIKALCYLLDTPADEIGYLHDTLLLYMDQYPMYKDNYTLSLIDWRTVSLDDFIMGPKRYDKFI